MDSDPQRSGQFAYTEHIEFPQTRHSPFTPEGEVEQAGLIASGFRYRRYGWRKVVVRIGLTAIGLMFLIVIGTVLFAPRV